MRNQTVNGDASAKDLAIATQDAMSDCALRASGVSCLLGHMFYGEIEEKFRPSLQSLTWSMSAIDEMLSDCNAALEGDPAASSPRAVSIRLRVNQAQGIADLVRGALADELPDGATSSRFSDGILANALHSLNVAIEKLRGAIDEADPSPLLQ